MNVIETFLTITTSVASIVAVLITISNNIIKAKLYFCGITNNCHVSNSIYFSFPSTSIHNFTICNNGMKSFRVYDFGFKVLNNYISLKQFSEDELPVLKPLEIYSIKLERESVNKGIESFLEENNVFKNTPIIPFIKIKESGINKYRYSRKEFFEYENQD